ncbi:MAG TPA: carboxypeptidase-like regulatory domain-containing protein, partial [Sphingobacteriaceae bacterium]
MKKKVTIFLSVLYCFFATNNVLGQGGGNVVSGTVISKAKGETLPGVSIKVKGTSIGTSTDVEGKYSLRIPNGESTLVLSYLGYKITEVPVNGRASINVAMEPDITSLTEVVVVGYSQQSKSNITASISKINPEELENTTNPNPVQAIQGKIAGVSIPISSGQPGQGAT